MDKPLNWENMQKTRQETILSYMVEAYIKNAEPVGSKRLCDDYGLDCSSATVRAELLDLEKKGFLIQPHTSAGRIPTKKAYKYFADKITAQQGEPRQGRENEPQREFVYFEQFIVRQVRFAHEEMEQEMKFMEDLMDTLEKDNLFEILNILEKWHKKIK